MRSGEKDRGRAVARGRAEGRESWKERNRGNSRKGKPGSATEKRTAQLGRLEKIVSKRV